MLKKDLITNELIDDKWWISPLLVLLGLLILVEQFPKDSEKVYNFYLENIKAVNNWDLVDLTADFSFMSFAAVVLFSFTIAFMSIHCLGFILFSL